MSINIIMSNAASGLRAAQAGISATSDNMANVDNARYARKVVDVQSAAYGGRGAGIEIVGVRRVTDQFLQSANLSASANASHAGVMADLFDQVQALFGMPTEAYSVSNQLQSLFAGFTTLAAADPSLTARSGALTDTSAFFTGARDFAGGLTSVIQQADGRAGDDIGRANVLLSAIAEANREISRGGASGADVTGLQQQQSEMIDELSGLLDIRVQHTDLGGSIIRAFDGREIAGMEASPLTLEMVAGERQLVIHTTGSPPQVMNSLLQGGSIKGYLDFVNTEAPAVEAQLTELVTKTADQLNRVHNAHTTVPAPTSMQGKVVAGLDAMLATQTGTTTIGLLDDAGAMTAKVDIAFTGGGAGTVNGVAFTDGATFLAALNTAMAPGSATFAGGRLSLDGGGSRLAVTSAPSPASGPGFSYAFGLNDLIVGGDPDFTIRPDILAGPQNLALAKADLSGAVGPELVILKGDTRGAEALGEAGSAMVNFAAAGGLPAGPQSLTDYVKSFGSSLARKTDAAVSRQANQEAVADEAKARRAAFEGVNLDEELVKLTSYQQSYSASARVMQAVDELYQVLLNLGR